MYGQRPKLPINLYFGTKKADKNATTRTDFVQQLHERLKWGSKTTHHVIEKENKWHKQTYNHKIRCTQLVVGDKILLKRTTFQGNHKTQDHFEDTMYCVEGQSYAGLPVFKIAPVAGEGILAVSNDGVPGTEVVSTYPKPVAESETVCTNWRKDKLLGSNHMGMGKISILAPVK